MASVQLSDLQREALWEVIKEFMWQCSRIPASVLLEACDLAPLLGHSAAELDQEVRFRLIVNREDDGDMAILKKLEQLGFCLHKLL